MTRTRKLKLQDYPAFMQSLTELSAPLLRATLRNLARTDLYFLLRYLLKRADVEHPWLFDRVRQVEEKPNGHLDLWARGHYKSTIITYAKTIQDILASHGDDPLFHWKGLEPTFCIFSHTRPIAKAFLRQIKQEFEFNEELQDLFPDILYPRPESQAPKWSEDVGITVIRSSNPKEATVEAWGLVDGQPISKHFNVLIYDDVVVRASVNTPEMIQKTTEMWELSLNLGSVETLERYIGTRYHWADSYRTILSRNAAIGRIHAGTEDATLTGEPVFLTREQWDEKVERMGPVTAASQLLQNPSRGTQEGFNRDWIMRFDQADVRKRNTWKQMNRYLICDPANDKKKGSDYTAMGVIGLAPDNNFYLLDGIRDRLNLEERTSRLFELHRKWGRPKVGYEQYGKDSDIQHIKYEMKERNYRFGITELGGPLKKNDRIRRMIPEFKAERWWLPDQIFITNYEKKVLELIDTIIEEEIMSFPVPVHDDFIDMMSRIHDMSVTWPKLREPDKRDRYADPKTGRSFMSA